MSWIGRLKLRELLAERLGLHIILLAKHRGQLPGDLGGLLLFLLDLLAMRFHRLQQFREGRVVAQAFQVRIGLHVLVVGVAVPGGLFQRLEGLGLQVQPRLCAGEVVERPGGVRAELDLLAAEAHRLGEILLLPGPHDLPLQFVEPLGL